MGIQESGHRDTIAKRKFRNSKSTVQMFGRFRNWFLNLPSYSIWQQALQGLLPKFSKYRNL